jgi:L-malate glycosyltransferase
VSCSSDGEVRGARAISNEADAHSVLHVVWSMGIGGAERSVYQLARQQLRTGVRSDVLVASRPGHYAEAIRRSGASIFALHQRHVLDPRVCPRFLRISRAYDVIHFHGVEPLLMLAASRSAHGKLVYTHRAGCFVYPFRRRLRYRTIAPFLRRHFSISANTKQGARAAASLFGVPFDSVAVTYNGIDFGLLMPQRSRESVLTEVAGASNPVRVGTSANFRDWKRIDRLLRAVAQLRDESIHCVLIGDGPARRSLERLTLELDISDLVTFTGRVEKIGDYLQTLDVFVLPSGPEESFGNAAVEAMGVGIPAIVFADGGGLTEHVDDGRTGFVVGNESELSLRLRELVRDRGLRKRLGGEAQRLVRSRYRLQAMANAYAVLYGWSDDLGEHRYDIAEAAV